MTGLTFGRRPVQPRLVRRWFKACGPNDNVPSVIAVTLLELYGKRAQLVEVQKASEQEELQYVRDAGHGQR